KSLACQGLVQEGKRIDYDIFVVNTDGTGLKNVTPNEPFDQEWPEWSPDGSRILFQSELDDGEWGGPDDICTVTPDGKTLRNLTKTDEAYEFQAHWSPDGSHIAFVSTRETQDGDPFNHYDIFMMDKDGKNLRKVTNEGTIGAFNPAFSPDGTRIAYTQSRNDSNIATIKVDGTDRKLVAELPGEDQWPEWSPDGQTIAFSHMRRNITFEMYTVPAQGGETASMLEDSIDERLPRFSPDGKTIVFQGIRDGDGLEDIFACDADGQNLRRLTPYPEPAPPKG
ncbi:MAG: hypothetical protein AB1758_21950, partial [Candidatus Eremiobacterota bacterium]